MSPRKRRKARPGLAPEVRRFDDLLRDLESIRRRLRNYRAYVSDMALLAGAMRRQLVQPPLDDNSGPFDDDGNILPASQE